MHILLQRFISTYKLQCTISSPLASHQRPQSERLWILLLESSNCIDGRQHWSQVFHYRCSKTCRKYSSCKRAGSIPHANWQVVVLMQMCRKYSSCKSAGSIPHANVQEVFLMQRWCHNKEHTATGKPWKPDKLQQEAGCKFVLNPARLLPAVCQLLRSYSEAGDELFDWIPARVPKPSCQQSRSYSGNGAPWEHLASTNLVKWPKNSCDFIVELFEFGNFVAQESSWSTS